MTSTGSNTVPKSQTISSAAATGAILLAVVADSFVPAVLHLFARNDNPFYFHIVMQIVRAVLLVAFLAWKKKAYLDAFFSNLSKNPSFGDRALTAKSVRSFGLASISAHMGKFSRTVDSDYGEHIGVKIDLPQLRRPLSWIAAPIVWIGIGSLNYAFFVWSANLVETAIASIAYFLWPLFAIFGIARTERLDLLYRMPESSGEKTERLLSGEQIVLSLLAVVGLIFVLGSQASSETIEWRDIFNVTSVIGLGLGLLSAVLAALNVIGTLAYGEVLYYQLVDEKLDKIDRRLEAIEDRGPEHVKLLLWLTLLGFAISIALGLPIAIAFGVAGTSSLGVSAWGMLGATIMGVLAIAGAVLLRLGNIGSPNPSVNIIVYLTPVFALVILGILGVALPRFDLFVVGAALVLAINVLLRAKPDEERDVAQFGKARARGIPLGFTAFILAAWFCGTIIVLRDEFMPSAWLSWQGDEYWSLMALSATVFALILGFRMARLTGRITREDEILLSLFRDGELLVRRQVLMPVTVEALAEFDTAAPRDARRCYNRIRQQLKQARSNAVGDNEDLLLSVEKQLDLLAHSKQLGRDIVELLSLTAFAIVTIGLGLFARPKGLHLEAAEWTAFLSEVFVLLFVATVAFLCVNLFDRGRERQLPLIVSIEQYQSDYGVFFRQNRKRGVRNLVAIGFSTILMITYALLLYDKWL